MNFWDILLKERVKSIRGEVDIIIQNVHTGEIQHEHVKNMVVTLAKNSIAGGLVEQTNKITYCALGTGTNAPALGNTTLQTEIARKLISVRSASGNVATFQTFFTTSEGNGTLREAGLFGNSATSTTDSGTLFCRTNISRTKTSSDTLTLSWTVTIG